MKKLITAAAIAGISIALPVTAAVAQTTVLSGQFHDADASHTGSGTATIVRSNDGALSLQLTSFQTIAGPSLQVWLSEADDPQSSSEVKQSEWLSLGGLQATSGDQTYEIPEGTDLSKYKSIVVWCQPFSVLFTAADLN